MKDISSAADRDCDERSRELILHNYGFIDRLSGVQKHSALLVSVCDIHLSVGVAAVGGNDSEGVVKKFVEVMTEVEAESSQIM